jgi:O-antigen/teichoic acid export membrane protein
MIKTNIYLRNLTANWLGYGVKLVVLFFMSPFLIHSLGNARYGVWILLVSLTGYVGLMDIGVMASMSRHINLYLATNNRQKIGYIINTSLFFYMGMCLILALGILSVSPFLGRLFPRIPDALIPEARWLLFLFYANIFLGFIAAVFRQLLAANDRFDLDTLSSLAVLGFSTTGTILLLKHGYGLVPLAIVQVVSTLLGVLFLYSLAKRYGPEFNISSRLIRRDTLRELVHFGIYAFIADVGAQLIFYTGSLVIGILIGAAAITVYNIGLMLVEHSLNLMKEFRKVLMPDLLKLSGLGALGETRWLILKSTRFFMLLAVPILVGLITLGNEFIFLWMGPGFHESASVLSVLAISQLMNIASFSCWTTLMGRGNVKFLAIASITEGLLSVCLSVLLVVKFHLGVVGVALGSAIPMVALTRVIVPVYCCRIFQIPVFEFARETLFRWLPAALLFSAPCFLASRIAIPPSWTLFMLKAGILSVVYLPIGFFLVLSKQEKGVLISHAKRHFSFLANNA